MNAKLFSISLLAVGVLLAGASPASASGYKFTDLGALGGGGGGDSSIAMGINNSGQVAGSTYTSGVMHAIIWNGTTPTDLGGGIYSFGLGINDSGQVVGSSDILGGDYHATLWNGTTPTDLGTLGGSFSQAWDINDSGQVVGRSGTIGNAVAHATLWNGTTPTDLGTLGGSNSIGLGINDSGQVVGSSDILGGDSHATIWNGTTPTDLGTLGGSNSVGFGINDSGQVVGWSLTTGNAVQHATLWNGTTPTDLGTLGGSNSWAYGINSYAYDINNSGQVVGFSEYSNFTSTVHATIWNGAAPTDLNNFLSVSDVDAGWFLATATSINDNGWIAGSAGNRVTGAQVAYLLTPCDTCPINIYPLIPEPETYAMFMAGLGLMGFIARRRKNGQS
jgi:probable HAF family extracellular repeat protein